VGGLAEFKFALNGSTLLAERPEDMLVINIIGDGAKAGGFSSAAARGTLAANIAGDGAKAGSFSYAATEEERKEGSFTLYRDGVIYDGAIEQDESYTLALLVADNSAFDIDRSPWSVFGSTEILRKPANFDPASYSSKSTSTPSSGGGGCSALGFPAAFLALAAISLTRRARR
jgi:hypothetical protein